ncbi:uncharacterized protein KZ484_018086 isoform 2-T2 [Pholidichthys leucotaenia]
MAPNKRKQKKSLKLDCEWGSCKDSFDRMETFSKHNEDHLVALKAEEEDEAEVSHFKCPSCDMTCPSPSSLRNHIEFLHSNEGPYSCDFCEHRCKNLVDLHKHLDSHSSESAFHCEVPGCGFTAPAACTMKFHHKKEHEERERKNEGKHHQLQEDEDQPSTANKAKSHSGKSGKRRQRKRHTGNKQYFCEECGSGSIGLSHLKIHKLIHSGVKQFVCEKCGKAFSHMSSLKTHKLIHTGVKPFVCGQCGKAFTQMSHFRAHEVTHTGVTVCVWSMWKGLHSEE